MTLEDGPGGEETQPTGQLPKNLFDSQTKMVERLERQLEERDRELERLRKLYVTDAVRDAGLVNEEKSKG